MISRRRRCTCQPLRAGSTRIKVNLLHFICLADVRKRASSQQHTIELFATFLVEMPTK